MRGKLLVWGGVAVAGLTVAGVALSASGSPSAGGSSNEGGEVKQRGLSDVKNLAAKAGMTTEYQHFLMLVARGESGGNNLVGLGNPVQFPPWTKTHRDWVAKGGPPLSTLQA